MYMQSSEKKNKKEKQKEKAPLNEVRSYHNSFLISPYYQDPRHGVIGAQHVFKAARPGTLAMVSMWVMASYV